MDSPGRGTIIRRNTVVDVLDRVLEQGLYLDADLVVCVADVPLIAARLGAVVAAVETMVAHGLAEERLLGSIPCAPPCSARQRRQGEE